MQSCINFDIVLLVCSPPLTRNGLTYGIETQQTLNTWVDGDKILYRCTGNGQLSGNATSECQGNGQWSLPSLQSLPSCCELNRNFVKFCKIQAKDNFKKSSGAIQLLS